MDIAIYDFGDGQALGRKLTAIARRPAEDARLCSLTFRAGDYSDKVAPDSITIYVPADMVAAVSLMADAFNSARAGIGVQPAPGGELAPVPPDGTFAIDAAASITATASNVVQLHDEHAAKAVEGPSGDDDNHNAA